MYPIGTTAKTGESCPVSGVWRVSGYPSTTAPIARGNRMPPYSGKSRHMGIKRICLMKKFFEEHFAPQRIPSLYSA